MHVILCMHNSTFISYFRSTLDFENGRNCDRFTLGIPYCGAQIECEAATLKCLRISLVLHGRGGDI